MDIQMIVKVGLGKFENKRNGPTKMKYRQWSLTNLGKHNNYQLKLAIPQKLSANLPSPLPIIYPVSYTPSLKLRLKILKCAYVMRIDQNLCINNMVMNVTNHHLEEKGLLFDIENLALYEFCQKI